MKVTLNESTILHLIQDTYGSSSNTVNYLNPSIKHLNQCVNQIHPLKYAKTRNYLQGYVTQLSRYISSGVISISSIVDTILEHDDFSTSTPLLQQLLWRAYFKHVLSFNPEATSLSLGLYKTGFNETDYSHELPDDILNAQTPNLIINYFISTLVQEGYLHNHARLYLSSYMIHFRRIHWSVGANWMFYHLVDADIASNSLSWQWVASTSSNKPYFFNLENIQKYVPSSLPISNQDNPELVGTYEELAKRLFPKQGGIR